MMPLKLSLGLCALFLMIWSSSADEETTTQKYRNYNGPIYFNSNDEHPSKRCAKVLNNPGSYWQTTPFEGICSQNIRCKNWPNEDQVLDEKPVTGTVCDLHGRYVCLNGECEYLIFEEIAQAIEEQSRPKKIYSNYDGEVINPGHEKFPTNMCAEHFKDAAAEWSNRESDDSCSADILCYVPNMLGTMNLLKKPENGVVVDWPAGRTLCFDGKRKAVEYYVPEVVRRPHRLRGHYARYYFGKQN